jgi:PAS domain S-box-containing protein
MKARVLIIEDELLIAEDLRAALTHLGYTVAGMADSADEAVAQAERVRPDLVLMDIKLRGERDGISAAEQIREEFGLPVIFLTAHADEATLARAGRSLAFGYLVKPFEEQGLDASIEMALQLHDAQSRLQETERWLATTLESIGDAVVSVDLEGRITFLNPSAERITGWPLPKARGRPFQEVVRLFEKGTGRALANPVMQALEEDRVINLADNTVLRPEDGREIPVDDCAAPIRDTSGTASGVVLVLRDISARLQAESERRLVEQKLQAAQRLESLGILAGGVAHDFNNLLLAIISNAELGRGFLPPGSPAARHLEQIEIASMRAAELCRQLVAYAGHGAGGMCVLDLNALIHETSELLRATIPKNIELRLALGEKVPLVEGERNQIQRILMNLAINASEAMEGKDGFIEVRTSRLGADRACLSSTILGQDLPEGDYALLEVRDNGCGMTSETISRVFEPFFSTKFLGRGLGLAAVYGIVRDHHGALQLQSERGIGSTFGVLLPGITEPVGG